MNSEQFEKLMEILTRISEQIKELDTTTDGLWDAVREVESAVDRGSR
jgi:archaellum component FlaC